MWNLKLFLPLVLIHTCITTLIPLRPHILFIMADDIGYQDVGFRGSHIPTPNIDRLADSGVVLDFHYVMPQCSPTRAAFLSGRNAIRTGSWYGNMKPGQVGGLDLEAKTVAEMLREHQYKRHLVGKWHLGMASPDYTPVSRGFDTFLGMYLGSGDYFKHQNGKSFDMRLNYRQDNGRIVDKILRSYATVHSTEIYTNRTIDLLEQHVDQYGTGSDEPLFIFLSYQAPHGPYQVPVKYKENLPEYFQNKSGPTRTYAGMVNYMDEGIGRIYSRLTQLNMIENTLIVFTSDNGALMDGPGSNFPLRGGKKDYYEGGIRALTWVNSPLLQKTGYVNTHLHHISDWYPTFEYLASGANKRKSKRKKNVNAHVDGVNIWDSISSDSSCRDTVIINIQRTDLYNSDGVSQREKLRVDTAEMVDDVNEGGDQGGNGGGNGGENGGEPEGSYIHVARPEDGTEIIDEDPEEAEADDTDPEETEAEDTDNFNITEDSGVVDTNATIINTEETKGGQKKKKAAPFKDLVVYIWKSWKIIIGNEKSLYAGWRVRNEWTILNSEAYQNDSLDDTENSIFLYELNTDPKEKRNIAHKFPGMVKEMVNRINKNHWDDVKPIPKFKYSSRGMNSQQAIWRPWLQSTTGEVMYRLFEDADSDSITDTDSIIDTDVGDTQTNETL